MIKWIPIVLAALLLTGCTGKNQDALGYRQISMEEAAKLMEQETDYLLLDVRTAEEFQQGHIPEAMNLPNEDIGTQQLTQLPQKDQLLLIYCRSGNRSKQAAKKLVNLGYTNVVEIGGIIDWTGDLAAGD